MSVTQTIPINGSGKDRPSRIVAHARECYGTIFRHQGRLPGVGMDCVGVVLHVWHRIGLPPYKNANYGRSPHPSRMTGELQKMLRPVPIGEIQNGDILHMAWGKHPQHLALVTDVGIIHAYETIGRVVEHPLDDLWRSRVRAAYRFPEVN